MKNKNRVCQILAVILFSNVLFTSCKKTKDEHVPPDMVFKTGTGYTSGDASVAKNDTVKIGITATKTEDELKSYNISYAYDGASTTATFLNHVMLPSEFLSYSKDTLIVARNMAGSEKWTFSIVDRDGNITQKSVTLTVQ